jgi:hypothetical protein
MPNFRFTQGLNLLNYNFSTTQNVQVDGTILKSPILPAAKAGTLTTRTNDTTGELTLASGHGVTTGDRLDVYFASGIRVNVTVGTVAGNVVPISSGSGAILPAQGATLTVCVPQEEAFVVPTASLNALGVRGNGVRCVARFVSDSPADVLVVALHDGTQDFIWAGIGTNPFDSDDVVAVFLSHADANSARQVTALAAVD